MVNIMFVIETALDFMNTELTFAPFTFTPMQIVIAFFSAELVVNFIRRIFN